MIHSIYIDHIVTDSDMPAHLFAGVLEGHGYACHVDGCMVSANSEELYVEAISGGQIDISAITPGAERLLSFLTANADIMEDIEEAMTEVI